MTRRPLWALLAGGRRFCSSCCWEGQRPANVDGKGAVGARELVRTAQRKRLDRIIVGEVRSGEAFDMLQAMNTGHDCSLTTVHANTPRDAISRIENLVLMAGFELPMKAIREQIASAIVQADQMSLGVAEVLHGQAEEVRLRRRQRAEEAAMKAPVKMLFPVLARTFPAMMTVLLEPAIWAIYVTVVRGGGLGGL